MKLSPTTYALADLLYALGWRPDCDAQYTGLDKAIFDGRVAAALNAEKHLRDYLATTHQEPQA